MSANFFARGCLLIFVISQMTGLVSRSDRLAAGADWSQFRGPNASGISTETQKLPSAIGPESTSLLWKVEVGRGHSSPVIREGHVYLTTLRDRRLLTLALDCQTGNQVWEAEAPHETLEAIHRIGSHATPSVATDGTHVVSFFGSSGLLCYDTSGRQLWYRRLGPFNNQFGANASPLLVGDRIVMIQDHDTGSYLATYDVLSGKPVWRVDRPNFRRNYGTPIVWNSNGQSQVVTSGSAQVVAYDLQTGELAWFVRGVSRVVSSTPVVGEDGILYVANTGGSSTQQPSFSNVVTNSDSNNNGLLEQSELPKSPIKSFFIQFDRDVSGALDENEYESIRQIFSHSRTVAMAIKPGGSGDITESHVLWTQSKSIPRNPSPLYYNKHLYLVKEGGIVTTLAALSGNIVNQGRLADRGKYYSSPVVGDGKIYALSERGTLTVITAIPNWEQVATSDFGEECYASPAIADGRVFIRTVQHLYCFGRGSRATNRESP